MRSLNKDRENPILGVMGIIARKKARVEHRKKVREESHKRNPKKSQENNLVRLLVKSLKAGRIQKRWGRKNQKMVPITEKMSNQIKTKAAETGQSKGMILIILKNGKNV